MNGDEVTVEVYDKWWTRRGVINAPTELEAVWRLNKSSTATITLAASSPKAWLLLGEGNRVRILARGLVWSGWMEHWTLDGVGPSATITATFLADVAWLERLLCWQAPATLPGTIARDYDRRAGPAETVLKGYVQAIVDRLGLPLYVAPDLERGEIIGEQLRMHTPADKLLPLMEAAGLRVSLLHYGARHVTLDVDPIRTYPRTLTADSGILGADTSVSVQGPTVTRVVVGGAGEQEARLYRAAVRPSAEDAWGRIHESHIDARDLQVNLDDPLMDTQAKVDAAMDARAAAALAEGDAQVSVSATMSETTWFRIAAGVLEVGDRVPLSIAIPAGSTANRVSVALTETITEATLRQTVTEGLTVRPKLGRMRDDPSGPLLWRIARLSAEIRHLRTL